MKYSQTERKYSLHGAEQNKVPGSYFYAYLKVYSQKKDSICHYKKRLYREFVMLRNYLNAPRATDTYNAGLSEGTWNYGNDSTKENVARMDSKRLSFKLT